MIAFEFPIRWDDISGSLGDLSDKKKLEQLVDDLTIRDNLLEDYLNTNIVSGIVAGTNIAIDRATGVVTVSTTATPIPAGTIMQYAGSSAPTGWLLCNGGLLDRTVYAALFAVIGTTYNIGGGGETSSNFRLPNLENRVPVGKGAGTFSGLGTTGGSETFSIQDINLPPHKHTITHDHGNHKHTITHNHGNHDHSINHDHASFDTSSSGSHLHDVPYGVYKTENASDSLLAAPDGNGTVYYSTKSGDGNHQHAIDVPSFSGTSGQTGVSFTGDSGDQGVSFSGDSGNGPGTSTAISNVQPFLVLNYIIKP